MTPAAGIKSGHELTFRSILRVNWFHVVNSSHIHSNSYYSAARTEDAKHTGLDCGRNMLFEAA